MALNGLMIIFTRREMMKKPLFMVIALLAGLAVLSQSVYACGGDMKTYGGEGSSGETTTAE